MRPPQVADEVLTSSRKKDRVLPPPAASGMCPATRMQHLVSAAQGARDGLIRASRPLPAPFCLTVALDLLEVRLWFATMRPWVQDLRLDSPCNVSPMVSANEFPFASSARSGR